MEAILRLEIVAVEQFALDPDDPTSMSILPAGLFTDLLESSSTTPTAQRPVDNRLRIA
jgi:hypothetical protein